MEMRAHRVNNTRADFAGLTVVFKFPTDAAVLIAPTWNRQLPALPALGSTLFVTTQEKRKAQPSSATLAGRLSATPAAGLCSERARGRRASHKRPPDPYRVPRARKLASVRKGAAGSGITSRA